MHVLAQAFMERGFLDMVGTALVVVWNAVIQTFWDDPWLIIAAIGVLYLLLRRRRNRI
jgi:hypothetical protein